jgi:hypothetical protein
MTPERPLDHSSATGSRQKQATGLFFIGPAFFTALKFEPIRRAALLLDDGRQKGGCR